MTTAQQAIDQWSNYFGVPSWIPTDISQVESGGNPNAVGDNGTSFGLFQLHQGGGQGDGYTKSQLMDPSTNSQIAIQHMQAAYQAGTSQGLTGQDLLDYVANNSGHPGNMGVSWTKSNTNYDQKLNQVYQKKGSNPSSGSASAAQTMTGWLNDSSKLTTIGIGAVALIMILAGLL